MKKQPFRTWVEIDAKAIEANTRALRKLLDGGRSMMAVVKSNAYGHGMIGSAKAALRGGAAWLGVDEITEALELRKAGIRAPILVLGYTLPEFYGVAAIKKISVTISSLDSLSTLAKSKLRKKLSIHIKFDTGLHRQGISESQTQQAIRLLSAKGFPAIIEGSYTHFAAMEDPKQEAYSRMQAAAFGRSVEKLVAAGFSPITHASASSGLLFSPDFHFDMSRAGIALYGIWPSADVARFRKEFSLVPALAWKAIISEVKLVPKGSRIGYDLTHEVSRDSRIAVVPVGYWHGLPRALSNAGQALVCGKRASIVGRISMDMCVVDVSDIPSVEQGDEVVIIGSQGKETIAAEEVAEKAGTINYEILTRINPLLPRIYGKG